MTYKCERDVELVELALPLVGPSVVDVEEDDARDDAGVHEAGDEEEGDQPVLALSLLVLANPVLVLSLLTVAQQTSLLNTYLKKPKPNIFLLNHLPDLCPGVGKVNDEDELDEDEEEGADEPEVHPHIS